MAEAIAPKKKEDAAGVSGPLGQLRSAWTRHLVPPSMPPESARRAARSHARFTRPDRDNARSRCMCADWCEREIPVGGEALGEVVRERPLEAERHM